MNTVIGVGLSGRLFFRSSFQLSLLALFLVAYPALLAFLLSGSSAYFKFFAADAFFYLMVADNSSWYPAFSFDGSHPTNGFHPLWQVLLKVIFSLSFLQNNQALQIAVTFWLSLLFVAISSAIVAYRSRVSLLDHGFLVIVAVVPGFLYFFLATVDSNYGSTWSYINGMESPLSLLLFALLLSQLVRLDIYNQAKITPFFILGFIAALFVLARLDDIFMLGALYIPFLWANTPVLTRLRQFLAFSSIPLIIIGLYLFLNHQYAGTYLPISGQVKGGLAFNVNVERIMDAVLPMSIISSGQWGPWPHLTWRALHITIPALVAGVFIFYLLFTAVKEKKRPAAVDSVLLVLAIYVICKASYNLIFVNFWHQGHWYYPISILVANVIAACMISRGLRGHSFHLRIPLMTRIPRFFSIVTLLSVSAICIVLTIKLTLGQFSPEDVLGNRYLRLAAIMMIIAIFMACFAIAYYIARKPLLVKIPIATILSFFVIMVVANSMLYRKYQTSYNNNYEVLFNTGPEISRALLAMEPDFKLLSFDDGIVAYSLQVPTMSGLGFALDKEAFDAKRQGLLLKLAYDRGYRWITSSVYMPWFTGQISENVSDKIKQAFWMSEREAANWDFILVHFDPKTNLRIVRFEPKKPG